MVFTRFCSKTTTNKGNDAKDDYEKGMDRIRRIRNIGISAHIDSGKTTLTERLLYFTGRIDSMHEVKGKDRVGATMDFMELEKERGITIKSAATSIEWEDHFINIIDTPGHVDFTIEVERSLRVLDGAVLVICAAGGVQSQTLTVNRQLNRYNVPFVVFMNKLDRPNADPYNAFKELKQKLGYNTEFITIPIGIASENVGLIDIINRQAIYFNDKLGKDITIKEVPEFYVEECEERRKSIIECLSNVDEIIGEMYLNEIEPSIQQIHDAIRRCVIKRNFVPVFVGSALRNKGIQTILGGVLNYLPDPTSIKNYGYKVEPDGTENKIELITDCDSTRSLVLLAFKLEAGKHGQLTYMRVYQGSLQRGDILINTRTNQKVRIPRLVRMHAAEMEDIKEATAGDICATFGVDCKSGDTFVHEDGDMVRCESIFVPDPVMSLSLECKNNADFMRISKAINRFMKEDPTFIAHTDSETKELIISGMGELHLEIYTQRMKSEYNCQVTTGKPKVSYRETLKEKIKFDYLHKKQTGGAGQYAKIIGYIEPLDNDDDTIFENKVPMNILQPSYVKGIQKGFFEFCQTSSLTGSRLFGVKMVIEDGHTHLVDSSDYAFKLAAIGVLKSIFNETNTKILEPVMSVETVYPEEYHRNVLSLISSKNSLVKHTKFSNTYCTINASIPLNEMFGYSADLRRLTQGKGEFTMEFLQYDACSDLSQRQIISEHQKYRTSASS